jgi:hypothetical protein
MFQLVKFKLAKRTLLVDRTLVSMWIILLQGRLTPEYWVKPTQDFFRTKAKQDNLKCYHHLGQIDLDKPTHLVP